MGLRGSGDTGTMADTTRPHLARGGKFTRFRCVGTFRDMGFGCLRTDDVNSTPHTSHFFVFHSTHFNVTLTLAQAWCVAHFTPSHPHALMLCVA